MYYEAKLTFESTVAVGRAAKDHDAIALALADSRTIHDAPPSQVIVAVYRVTGADRDLAYAQTLREYTRATN